MNKSDIFWQTYLKIEKEMLEIAKYIYITDERGESQLNVYSPHIADLLVRVCIEIEALSKELYFDLGGTKPRGDKTLVFDTDCLKLIDINYKTSKKKVLISCPSFNITKDKNIEFRPLKEAHKQQGTDWERAYQAVKHDRYSSLTEGTVIKLIHALGALFLLNIYYRNVKLYSKYLEVSKLDFSFGSAIFSVKKPEDKYVLDVINNKKVEGVLDSNESPFILKYTNASFKSVLDANEKMTTDMQKYLSEQPELNEVEFQAQISQASKEGRLMIFWELCKYRINKRIPSSLPFEKRKELFTNSPEWNGNIRKLNHPKSTDEITEDNIQSEIDHAGIQYGMELQKRFEDIRLFKAFNEGQCELVLDNGRIKYE